MKRSLTDYPLAGKRALVRVDFNVPLEDGRVVDDTRIRAALPTITYLLDQGCSVVLMSHLGRPKGQVVDGLRMAPVAARLSELLGRPVVTADDCVGPAAAQAAAALGPARSSCSRTSASTRRRRATTPGSRKQLAALGDVYVNDAFGTAHRAHASTEGVTHYLPAVAGLLMTKELEVLGRLLRDPARPFVVVLGGLKVSDKISLIRHMLTIADTVLIGGAMANAFLAAKGYEVGASKGVGDEVAVAREILAEAGAARGRWSPDRRRGGARGRRRRALAHRARRRHRRRRDGARHRPPDHGRVRAPAGRRGDDLLERAPWACSRSGVRGRHAGRRRGHRRRRRRHGRRRRRHGVGRPRIWPGGPPHARVHRRRRLHGIPGGPGAARRGGAHGSDDGRDDGGRRPLMAGNWKMYKTPAQTKEFFTAFRPLVAGVVDRDVLICPPDVGCTRAQACVVDTQIEVGAQTMHYAAEGAFTGETAPGMLAEIGVPYVILGHSERRQYYNENDADLARKVRAALDAGLRPILCCGETLEEREAGQTESKVGGQLDAGLVEIGPAELATVAVAYEPIWAIGTGVTATPEQAQETVAFVRRRVRERFGDAADGVRILYGGASRPPTSNAHGAAGHRRCSCRRRESRPAGVCRIVLLRGAA